MIPFFLKHYSLIADSIIVYDNYSTDRSVALLYQSPKVTIRFYDTNDTLNDQQYLHIKTNAWKEARGKCDFVIIVDMDELLYLPPDLFTQYPTGTIFQSVGYNMINTTSTPLHSNRPLIEQVRTGMRDSHYDKVALFNPNAINDIRYKPGCHSCDPIGNLEWVREKVLLLHYKFVFGIDYVLERYRMYRARLSDTNKKQGLGRHYLEPDNDIRQRYEQMIVASIDTLILPNHSKS